MVVLQLYDDRISRGGVDNVMSINHNLVAGLPGLYVEEHAVKTSHKRNLMRFYAFL